MIQPPLPALRAFVEVGRRGGVKDAAAALGVTPGAVSQQVRALELRLGVVLLERLHRGVRLSAEGERLFASLDPGFRQIEDLWPPWCAAMVDGEIASLAFTTRLSAVGAELGLATAKSFRGRGLAAAATAGWTGLPVLHSRALFYSTSRTNLSSQRVVARLGLRFIGTSFRIAPLAPDAEPP